MKHQTRHVLFKAAMVVAFVFVLPVFSAPREASKSSVQRTPPLPIRLTDVPRTGPPVVGSAAIHEHVMAEHAFSGKWHWGSVDGPERSSLRLCDGDKDTHANAFGLCSADPHALGRDACCHSRSGRRCDFKMTNGKDPDPGDEKWDYLDWPIWDTQAHPRYWHGQLRRAHQLGLKLMVVHAVENYLFCSLVKEASDTRHPFRGRGYPCDHGDSFISVERQITELRTFVANHSDFMGIAHSPGEARSIIHSGKMAIVIGVEADYAWGNEKERIDLLERLNAYHALGVRTIFLAHQVNTRLAGAAIYQKALWAQQSFSNCFFRNAQCVSPNPNERPGPGNENQVEQSRLCCTGGRRCYASDYSQFCVGTLSRGANPERWDGFAEYPGGGVEVVHEQNFFNQRAPVRKNKLGLTEDGKRVVREMMKKGMLVEIGHVSDVGISAIDEISAQNFGYPLIASHGYARSMLFANEAQAKVAGNQYAFAGHEFALSDRTLDIIKKTNGILGHFIAPDPVPSYSPSGVTNNCPRSTRSLAQLIAYAVDRGVPVAWAGDFMGFGAGVAPRRGYSKRGIGNNETDWCGGNRDRQRAQGELEHDLTRVAESQREKHYFGTRGFAHFGLIKELHDDLDSIGLPRRVLNEFRDSAAENFIRTWEKSEFIGRRLSLPVP